jgi:hypothetical protein
VNLQLVAIRFHQIAEFVLVAGQRGGDAAGLVRFQHETLLPWRRSLLYDGKNEEKCAVNDRTL